MEQKSRRTSIQVVISFILSPIVTAVAIGLFVILSILALYLPIFGTSIFYFSEGIVAIILIISVYKNFNKKVFVINHLSILILMIGGTLSFIHFERFSMIIKQNEAVWTGSSKKNGIVKTFPFALKMNEMSVELFDPEIALVDKNGEIKSQCHVEGDRCTLGAITLDNLVFFRNGYHHEGKYLNLLHPGNAHVVGFKYDDKMWWITAGSNSFPPEVAVLGENKKVVLLPSKVKKFLTKLEYFTSEGESGNHLLKINNPLSLGGYDIYQFAYNENDGRRPSKTELEIVYDPYKTFIYIGIILLIIGNFLYLRGKRE